MAFTRAVLGRAALAVVATMTVSTAVLTGQAQATPRTDPRVDPTPAPTITSVTAQLDALGRQSEQLAEKFNAATIALAKVRADLAAAQRAALLAAQRRDQAQAQFVRLVQAQYEGGGPSNAFGAMMTSGSPQAYLDRQSYADLAASHGANVLTELRAATVKAAEARAAVKKLVKAARAEVKSLAAARTQVESRTKQLTTLLTSLTLAQRRAYAARNAATQADLRTISTRNRTDTTTTDTTSQHTTKKKKTKQKDSGSKYTVHAGNAAAQRAVDFALKQVGKPYVYSSAGPNSYDCSGLTMASWRRGGVSLPHQASAQYAYGHHVGWNELQPGDLMFLYWPIGHVQIYIGHGLAVSAPQPGQDVEIIRISHNRSDFHGATRLT